MESEPGGSQVDAIPVYTVRSCFIKLAKSLEKTKQMLSLVEHLNAPSFLFSNFYVYCLKDFIHFYSVCMSVFLHVSVLGGYWIPWAAGKQRGSFVFLPLRPK